MNRRKVLNNFLKSENKKVTYELSENLKNLKEQATRLRKCIAENGALKKRLCYYKAKTRNLGADQANNKKKKGMRSFILTAIRRLTHLCIML